MNSEYEDLKLKCGYQGKPQQWKYGFDLAIREMEAARKDLLAEIEQLKAKNAELKERNGKLENNVMVFRDEKNRAFKRWKEILQERDQLKAQLNRPLPNNEQQAFETWAKCRGLCLDEVEAWAGGTEYKYQPIQDIWEGWQARAQLNQQQPMVPDWSTAPSWANWSIVNPSGQIIWCENKPIIGHLGWIFSYRHRINQRAFPFWENSLQKRPAQGDDHE